MPAGHTTGKSALLSRSRLTLSLSLLLSLTTLGACSNIGFPGVYRINVEQGNIVDQEMVDQLKPADDATAGSLCSGDTHH